MTNAKGYQVGFGRPPLENQFRKGRSGNPAGRPKGAKSLSAVIAAGLAERIVVTQNGERRSITKLQAAIIQLANKAAAGDRHAAKLIIDLLNQAEIRDESRVDHGLHNLDDRKALDSATMTALRERANDLLREETDDENAG